MTVPFIVLNKILDNSKIYCILIAKLYGVLIGKINARLCTILIAVFYATGYENKLITVASLVSVNSM